MKKIVLYLLLTLTVLAGVAAFWFEGVAMPPRQFAGYVAQHSAGGALEAAGASAAAALARRDRMAWTAQMPPLRVGAQPNAPVAAAGITVPVLSAASAMRAIEKASPGDVITFSPGTYRFSGRPYIPTSSASGVTVRAERPGTVFLEFDLPSGFLVASPGWTFENLHIRGVCAPQASCEHAFHVVGRGENFIARNNTIVDFNTHFRIDGHAPAFPDHGRIEGNTVSNTSIRDTRDRVAAVDLVAASGWTVARNVMTDFAKAQGDRASYGVLVRGGGERNRVERNLIVCEQRLHGLAGQRFGVSFGGGGTRRGLCRSKDCASEQEGGVIEANLVASCSDEGIFLNGAANSSVTHNTLLDTAGIALAASKSGARVSGNIVDGRIAARDGARADAQDNLDTGVTRMLLGWHPQRALFAAPAQFDLRWDGDAPRRDAGVAPPADLCGSARPATAAYGAFEDFGACLAR
jgi:hypothetical protein